VTGASSGFGIAFARHLAERDADLIVTARLDLATSMLTTPGAAARERPSAPAPSEPAEVRTGSVERRSPRGRSEPTRRGRSWLWAGTLAATGAAALATAWPGAPPPGAAAAPTSEGRAVTTAPLAPPTQQPPRAAPAPTVSPSKATPPATSPERPAATANANRYSTNPY
jgi:hypothetical protein